MKKIILMMVGAALLSGCRIYSSYERPEELPLDSLYNTPGRCTARKQAHAAILRAVICKPKVLVLNGLLDDLPDLDTDTLWHILWELRPENSVLIYLSGAPAPRQIRWTQELRV